MIALESDDQLRQRMAWALSQIMVITPKQVTYIQRIEPFVDIIAIISSLQSCSCFEIIDRSRQL